MKNENKATINVNAEIDIEKDVVALFSFESAVDMQKKLLTLPAEKYISLYRLMQASMEECTVIKNVVDGTEVHIGC